MSDNEIGLEGRTRKKKKKSLQPFLKSSQVRSVQCEVERCKVQFGEVVNTEEVKKVVVQKACYHHSLLSTILSSWVCADRQWQGHSLNYQVCKVKKKNYKKMK